MIPYLLFYKIVQLFIVMFIGFILVKAGAVKGSDSKTLSKLALYVLMPAVLLNSFDISLTPEIKKGLILAFSAAIIVHLLLFLIDAIYSRLAKASGAERASVIYSNAANLIIPIVSFILGDEWVIYTCAFVAVQIIFIWTRGIALFEKSSKTDIKKIIFNPCILATLIGLAMMISGIRLPSFVKDISSSLGSMVGNVGMFIAGMLMADVSFKDIFSDKRVYLAVAMRMVVCPFFVLCVLKLILMLTDIGNAHNILLITFLASITPSASMVTQLAQVYNNNESLAVSINIVSTLMCIVTMPLFVMLY
ncbi:MAG: AEC family transporter [Clostridia bacterium]|nr:AEC family transporter [Clostridia bacterium]